MVTLSPGELKVKIINTAEVNTRDNDLTPDEHHWLYNGFDVCLTEEVLQNLLPHADDVAQKTYNFSLALQAPVLEMTLRGLLVNQPRKARVMREMRQKLTALEASLRQIVEEGVGFPNFNWRSPTQMSRLLYDVMGLPVQRKRRANGSFGPSTDRDALEKLSHYYIAEPIINHVLALRDLGKSLGFLETAIDSDGRMRTNFNIAGTNTGRFASSMSDFGTGTNLQNVASSLRSIFMADPGMKFANLDLEQGDSRNVGAICWNLFVDSHGEEFAGSYLDACESGDLHTFVCRLANPDLPWDQGRTDREIADDIAYRDKSYRDMAKVLGHGSNYLGTPRTMSGHSKIPVPLVTQFHNNYFTAFPCLPTWHTNVAQTLELTSHITTLFGRRRFFFGRPKEAATRREAVAYAPQSMTADEINMGILNLWRANRIQLLVQVHDSILFQYPEEQEDEIIPWALEALKTWLTLKRDRRFVVPTEAQVGWNWGYYGKDNPDGLQKWKGGDSRVRQETESKLSFRGL